MFDDCEYLDKNKEIFQMLASIETSKTRRYFQIGEYLGENKEPNLTVLGKFVELFEFQKMDIVTALRNFLGKFRLPGEAQKVRY